MQGSKSPRGSRYQAWHHLVMAILAEGECPAPEGGCSGFQGLGGQRLVMMWSRCMGSVTEMVATGVRYQKISGSCLRSLMGWLEGSMSMRARCLPSIVWNCHSLRVRAALRAGKRCIEIEIDCSDQAEHRRRADTRIADIAGHRLPTWQEICAREYEPWEASIVIDTAGQRIEASVSALREQLEGCE